MSPAFVDSGAPPPYANGPKMDPNYGFNSPSLGPGKPAPSLSRPPRLAKLRKPMAGHRPSLFRPVPNRVVDDSSTDSGGFQPVHHNAGGGFVFSSNSSGPVSSNSSISNFSESVASSDVERSKVVDELRGLRIGEKGGSSGGRDRGVQSIDQNVVSELPDEMRKLYIESDHFSKVYGGSVDGELPNKMKKLNIKNNECDGSSNLAFGGGASESLSGSSDAMLDDNMKKLNIEESLCTSADQKDKDNYKFIFGKSGNAKEAVDVSIASVVGNSSNQSGAETMHHMQTENLGDRIFQKDSGSFSSGFTLQAGLQSKNSGTHISCDTESTSTSSPLFASSDIHIKLVGGVPGIPSMDRADKKVEFNFASKLDSMDGKNVQFTTPDPKGHLLFGLNRKVETKREPSKDNGLKKKKGKWKKPVQVPLKFAQDFGFQENLPKYAESSEQYSPMDVSPYEEILADDSCSRETSVASEESFYVDDNNSSTEARPDVSNDIVDECLVSATERFYINKCDIKANDRLDEESSVCVNKGIGLESPRENAVSGAETESFKSANDELDYSSDSFITAADVEVSSSSSIERQDSDGCNRFKYDTTSDDFRQTGFMFSASSTAVSQSSASMGIQKKKSRLKVGHDSCSSTPNVKVSHTSSTIPPFQASRSSLLSPEQDQKLNFPNVLSRRRDKSDQVKELEVKQDSNAAASIAAKESCEKWRLRGNQAYAKGDFLRAEDCYTRGIDCIPQSEASRSSLRVVMLCYSNRAATRISLGRVREALEDCMKAAALDPSFLRAQVRAASCYLALGDVENATLHFMKCLQAGSDICADRKLLIEASEGLEKAQKVAECMKQASELLGRRTSSDIDSAVSLIAEALMISSYSEKLLQMKVDALLMMKKYEELIQFCEQLLVSVESNFLTSGHGHSVEFHDSNSKRRVWCWSLILKSYFYLGRLEEAIVFIKKQEESVSLVERSESKTLESMIPLVGTIRELLQHKAAGNEAYQSGNHAEAIEQYTAAISCSVESRPFAAICFCNRAAAYRAMGQIIDALADCSLAIALDGNYFKAISRRAEFYEMIRDYGQAVTDLQKLVSLLMKEVDKKTIQSGPSDKLNRVNELRQARLRLLEMEEADRKEIPLNMYLILGLDPSAAASEIRKAYRKAALKYHPDKAGQSLARNENPDDDGIWKEITKEVHKDAERLFKMIGEAYTVLSDPTKRSRYDLEEERRNASNRGKGSSNSKLYTDSQNYSFDSSGSRRRWQEVRRTYENTRTGSERNWYKYN
ncbi:hypothetical protein ACJIZ3_012031 [Penstemon smallii]|uniref:J domain-containing protein n=1 Tax=Penstemon smallii TaxID=265156 RepID=A0ABD3UKU6_9LAMI